MIAKGLPDRLRSNGFGVLGLTQAFGDLGATLIAGLLWSLASPTVAFGYAAAWMLRSVIASGLLTNPPNSPTRPARPQIGCERVVRRGFSAG